MEGNNSFEFVNDNGEKKQADIITVLEVNSTGKEYVVYTIDEDNDKSGVYVSVVRKDEGGQTVVSEIDSEEEKKLLFEFVNKLITGKAQERSL